jgi:hypothetical protein
MENLTFSQVPGFYEKITPLCVSFDSEKTETLNTGKVGLENVYKGLKLVVLNLRHFG